MTAWPVASGVPVKLHFGCGPRILRGFVNIDLVFEPFANYMQYYGEEHYPAAIRGDQSDFVAFDVRGGVIPLPDESVDLVFHEDFIEHLDQRSQVLFLAETRRLLKRGAVHRINTPDLLASMRAGSTFSRGALGIFAEEWDRHGHLNVLTRSTIEEYARMVGYSDVLFNAKNCSVSPLVPLEYRPGKDRGAGGNLFVDLVK